MVARVCVCTRKSTLETDEPQHDRLVACVIAQQYSFTTFVSLRFDSRMVEFGARF